MIFIHWQDIDAIYDIGEGEHIIYNGKDYKREDVVII